MNNRLLRIILIITPIAIVFAAAALLFVIILILNPDWELTRSFIYIRETVTATSMAAMVVATLFLAWATFSVINNSRQREERDRKERKLITIIEWATNIMKCETAVPLTPLPIVELAKFGPKLGKEKVDKIIEYRDINTSTNLIMRYQNFDVLGERIVLIAKTLDKQFSCNLEALAQKTAKKLHAHVKLGPKWIEGEVTREEYIKRWKSLVGSAKSLAEKAEDVMD